MARAAAAPGKRSKSSDEQLARYRAMRDFHVTREPSGVAEARAASADALPFVIQKHAATRLHYDFRLGWNGVLKSWAVTKGPSYFPGDKRLAVQVEDHPLEYGGFEGIIPKGQYGGGTVMLWDRGTWEPHVDVEEGLKNGSLKFALHGEKMKGNWALVRMGGRAANESKPNWLLIKEHDPLERAQEETPITEEAPDSVLSGRDLDAIARAEDRVWHSNRSDNNGAPAPEKSVKNGKSPRLPAPRKRSAVGWGKEMDAAPREPMPPFISPQLASLAKSLPSGERWIHEIKLDGYRVQARITVDKTASVQLLTRTGLDWTHRMKPIAEAAGSLRVKSAILDGEVVVLTPSGTTSFANLQAAFQEGAKHELTYFAFDLLHLDGHNLRELPLMERKQILETLLTQSEMPESIRLSQHIAGDAQQIFKKACELGTEGLVSKLAAGKYQSGRGGSWLKIKCYTEQEFVIGGFTLPSNGTHGIGALLLGYYRNGKLVYAGRTGTGFTQKTHRMMRDRLDELHCAKPSLTELPTEARRGAIWVKPELVAQVSFSNWTADNLVRQAAFKGLREDKPAKTVQREEANIEPNDDRDNRPKASRAKVTVTTASKTIAAKRVAAENGDTLPIRLTHPDKILDATSGVTKEILARYYMAVSDAMLPYIAGRPLTLVRCVDGSGKPCFYQKHKNEMLGDAFESIDVVNRKTGEHEPYITLSSSKAIAQLAQIGVLEVHPWGSRNESLEQPDQVIFDLDPDPSIGWDLIAESAKNVRKRLKALGLQSFVKTTGGKGLHVVVPVHAEHEWPAIKQFAHTFVLGMEKDFPKLFLTKMTKAARTGKIFLDYLRNDRGATAVAPFSPRSRPGLPVAVPLAWSELDANEPPRFFVSEFEAWKRRLARNPWKEMAQLDQHLALPS